MKIQGKIIENSSIAKNLNSQKMNESLRAKIQNLLTLKPFAETKEVYVSEQRIAKMRTNYSLRPVVTWELAQNEDDLSLIHI